MKTIILSLLILTVSTSVMAQESRDDRSNRSYSNNNYNAYQTPQRVQQGWQRDHPNNINPNWQKARKHWDAQYRDETTNRNVDTYYDRRGRVVDTHREWDRRDFPNDFDNRIRERYQTNDYTVTRIDRPRNTSLFQILLNLGGGRKTIYMDEQGNEVRYRDRH